MPKRKPTGVGRQAAPPKPKAIVHYTRDGRRRPKKCDQYLHTACCRPGRPLCWRMRLVNEAKYGVCNCGVVLWPHRTGYCETMKKKLSDAQETYLREKAEWEAYKKGSTK